MWRRLAVCVSLGTLVSVLGSGCAWTTLQEHNRRLKESNELLIAENNRLAQELDDAQRRVSGLEAELTSIGSRPAAEPVAVATKPAARVSESLIIPDVPSLPEVQIDRTDRGIRLTLPERVFFSSGQAQLSSRGQQILAQIANVLNQAQYRSNIVRVDGHTDDVPVRKVRHIYPTNWELSTARACTVVRYLTDRGGVSKSRIFPAGFADQKPIAHARSDTARQQNRRVEITILDEPA